MWKGMSILPVGQCCVCLFKELFPPGPGCTMLRCFLAAEANIMGDPEAADFVFGQTPRIRVVGLDVTHICQIPAPLLSRLRDSQGRFGPFLYQAVQFYLQYHRQAIHTPFLP